MPDFLGAAKVAREDEKMRGTFLAGQEAYQNSYRLQAASKTTPFDDIGAAHAATRELIGRVESLAVRLVGDPVIDRVNGPVSPMSAGLFNETGHDARSLMSRISEANAALSRIEEALP